MHHITRALLTLAGGAAVCGCGAAPIVPITRFQPAELPTIEQAGGVAGSFAADDGVKLRYARFAGQKAPRTGTVVLVTGRTQFIEVYLEQIANFTKRGFDVWAMDWRGQGLSGGHLADAHKGHIATFNRYIADLHHFRTKVVQPEAGPKVLVSQSMGAGISLRYLIEHAGQFDKAILGAPLVGLNAPGWLISFVSWQGKSSPEDYVPGEGGGYGQHAREFDGNKFTRDEARFLRVHAYIDREPKLALGAPTKGWIRAAQIHCEQLAKPEYARRLTTPVLMLAAEDDKLVDNDAEILMAERAPAIKRALLPGTLHEVWLARDATQQRVWREIDGFVGVAAE